MKLLLVVLLGVSSLWARVFTEVKTDIDECFDQVVVSPVGLRGSFEVIEGGRLDINVLVTLGSKVVHQLTNSRRGDLEVSMGAGTYTVCFTTSGSNKIVGFSLHGELGGLLEDEDAVKEEEHVKPVKHAIDMLAFKIQKLQEHERYLGERMHRHIQTAENTSNRVFYSTLFEAIVLLAVNLVQVWYMKRYFETRRRL